MRFGIRRFCLFLSLAYAGATAIPAHGDQPRATDAGNESIRNSDGRRDVLCFGPKHCAILRLHLKVDGQPFDAIRTERANRFFSTLDKDQSGALDKSEVDALPAVVGDGPPGNSPQDIWAQIDIAPADGRVVLEEFAAYIDSHYDVFVINAAPQKPAQRIDLFPQLDTNGDGQLSKAELSAIRRMLRKLDVNDDESFSMAELQPFEDPSVPRNANDAVAPSSDLAFITIPVHGRLDSIAQEVSRRYGKAGNKSEAGGVSREALNLDGPAFKRYDHDGDGLLDAAELANFLASPVASAELNIDLFRKERKRPVVGRTVEAHVAGSLKAELQHQDTGNKVSLALGAIDVDLRAVSSQLASFDTRQLFKLRFRMADRDKNKYLDEQEFSGVDLPNANFKVVDADADGKVFEEELLNYCDRDSAAAQSRVTMTVASDGKSLFEILDANLDRRLSLRELSGAADRLAEYDRDGDGQIALSELAGRFRITIELGKPAPLREAAPMDARPSGAPILPRNLTGPDWFARMDRNRDGDVSWREFPGTRDAFRKLDANGDGVISVTEAEMVK